MPEAKKVSERIEGWKHIEAYVGKCKGTIKKWARKRGFPLRSTANFGTVFIFTEEVDRWWKSCPKVSQSATK